MLSAVFCSSAKTTVLKQSLSIRRELAFFFVWYNEHRPHTKFGGKMPNEVYFRLRPESRRPRIEPRKRWRHNASCAAPRTLIAGQLGGRCTFEIGFQNGKRRLPIVSLKRAA